MARSAGTPVAEQPNRAALIMRIISGLGLALLLITGIAAAAHLDGTGAARSDTASAAAVAPRDAAAPAVLVTLATASATVAAPALDDSALGTACILGALCGLLLALLVVRMRSRGTPLIGVLRVLRTARPSPRGSAPRAATRTLAQLGICRT